MSTRSPKRDTIGSNTLKVKSGTSSSFTLDLSSVIPASGISNIFGISDVTTNPSGDIIYLVNSSGVILQYRLPFPNGSIREMVFEKQSNTSILGTSSSPVDCITFSEDGTKLFVTHSFAGGGTVPDIRRYSLGSTFDIGTVSLDAGHTLTLTSAKNLGFQFNMNVPRHLRFTPDGTTVFLLESGIDTGPRRGQVLKVNLRKPWDLTTAYNTFNNFVANDITALRFVDNGNKMIVLNGTTDNLLEYTLPNPYEHYNANLTANLQLKRDLADITPTGFDFSPDGKKLYVLCDLTDALIQYELSTPWSISSGKIDANLIVYKRIFTEDSTPSGVTFSSDGNTMYVMGYNSDRIHQYSLSEAWNPNTATNIAAISVSAQDTVPYSIYYGNSGYSIYIQGTTGDDINQYNMSNPGIITSATFANVKAPGYWAQAVPAWSKWDSVTTGMTFSPDGQKVYVSGTTYITQASLNQPWDISTLNDTNKRLMQVDPRGFRFGNVGYNLYVSYTIGNTQANIHQYSLRYPYDVGSITYQKHFATTTGVANNFGIDISADGSNLYIVKQASVEQFTLSTPWDIGSAVRATTGNLDVRLTVGGDAASLTSGVRFKPDGNVVYVVGTLNDRVHQFNLGIPWMISTAANVAALPVADSGELLPYDLIFLNPEGTQLAIVGDETDNPKVYDLPTPWQLAGATFNSGGASAIFDDQETIMVSVDMRPDGKQVTLLGFAGDTMQSFYLPNAYSLATAFPSFRDTAARQFYGVRWSNTGSELFVIDRTASPAEIVQYHAEVPYDMYSINYTPLEHIPVFYTNNIETAPNALDISADNRYLYILGETNDTVYRLEFLDPANPRVDRLKSPIQQIKFSDLHSVTTNRIRVIPGNILISAAVTGAVVPDKIRSGINDINFGDGNVWTMSNTYSNVMLATAGSAGDTAPGDIAFVNNGSRAIVLGMTNDSAYQHNLSQPYNIATAQRDTVNVISFSGIISTAVTTIDISNGEWLFVGDTTSDSVYRYGMPTANSLSGLTSNNLSELSIFDLNIYERESYLGSTSTTGHAGIDFNTDGTKMFYCSGGRQLTNQSGYDGNAFLFEFNLPQPYDIGGAVPSGNQIGTSTMNRAGRVTSIIFSRDGKTLYMVDNQTPGADGGTRLSQIYFIDKNTLYSR